MTNSLEIKPLLINGTEVTPAYFNAEEWAHKTSYGEYYFDERAAEHACEYYRRHLKFIEGKGVAGQPFDLTNEPWLRTVTRTIYGFKRKSDNLRRFRIVFIMVPRKNIKTTWIAGQGGYLGFCDGEPGAQVYFIANNEDQARLSFNILLAMRNDSPLFKGRTLASAKGIVNAQMRQKVAPLSADADTKDGLNTHAGLYDEFHKFKGRKLFDVIHTSTAARMQPLEIIITVAGDDEKSLCAEFYRKALKVRDGILRDDEFLPVIYAADKEDDFTDPRTWAKANPCLGRSVRIQYMEKEAAKAKAEPGYENTFKRQHLNIWTQQAERYIPMASWDKGGTHPLDTPLEVVAQGIKDEEEKLKGRKCYLGLDLARVNDLSALALLFPPVAEKEKWKALFRFWCPKEGIIKRSDRDLVDYRLWERFKFLQATDGNTTDFKFIQAEIMALAEKFQIVDLAYDRTFAEALVNDLKEDGIPLVQHGMGFLSMAAPTAELLRLVLGENLWHGGHPIARWCADNLVVAKDPAGNCKPDKEKAREKIDGMVALIMATSRGVALHEKQLIPGIVLI
jgi:phage terminase large subunit-like protein